MAALLEAYAKRLTVAENLYKKTHNGTALDNQRKLITAKCLDNVSKYLSEAYEQSVGTQRSDL